MIKRDPVLTNLSSLPFSSNRAGRSLILALNRGLAQTGQQCVVLIYLSSLLCQSSLLVLFYSVVMKNLWTDGGLSSLDFTTELNCGALCCTIEEDLSDFFAICTTTEKHCSPVPMMKKESKATSVSRSDREIARYRWKPNARERARVQAMRTAFERLDQHLPRDPAEKQLTHSQIIRRAINYIKYLQSQVSGEPDDVRSTQSTQGTTTSNVLQQSPSPQASADELLRERLTRPSTVPQDQKHVDAKEATSERHFMRPHRVAINAVTRIRSRNIRLAFETLRESVPVHPREPKPNKARLLRRASEYISFMREMLNSESAVERSPLSAYDSPCGSSQNSFVESPTNSLASLSPSSTVSDFLISNSAANFQPC